MSQNFDEKWLQEIVFDTLEPIEVPVKIPMRNKATGSMELRDHVLREASKGNADLYRNAMARAMKVVGGMLASVEGMPDTEALLISFCLFEVVYDKEGRRTKLLPVDIKVIKGWKNSIGTKLFKVAQKISGLGPKNSEADIVQAIADLQEQLKEVRGEKEDPSKNSPTDTTESSDERIDSGPRSTESSGAEDPSPTGST